MESRRRRRGDDLKTGCSVEATLALIGGRWKGVVLYWLLGGKMRFGELRRRLPSCTARMLTLQLRELEEDEFVTRTVFAEVPPRVEYELTARGRTLEPILHGIRDWGDAHTRARPACAPPAPPAVVRLEERAPAPLEAPRRAAGRRA